MAIRDDSDDELGWSSAGPGILARWLPPAIGDIQPLERPQVSKNITTTDSFRKGNTTLCEQCAGPILAGTYPTAGHSYGALVCQTCSEAMGRASSVGPGKRPRGRPRKYQQEGS